jgi:hypothetical protein
MPEGTRRLDLLDAALCRELLAEALRRPFTRHARGRHLGKGPLRQGETAYILDLSPTGEFVYEDNLAHFPAFRAFVAARFATEKIGKAYWHRLGAGKAIYRHIDCGSYYDRTQRYQLFPDSDSGHVALIDGVEERYASGMLLAFDPGVPHAYENRSARECVFLVFDLYRPHTVTRIGVGL